MTEYLEKDGIKIPVALYNNFLTNTINKIFKILPVFEECEANGGKNYDSFNAYIDKVVTMLAGCEYLYDAKEFGNIVLILKGLSCRDDLTHKTVRSIVFHCITIVDNLKKD